MRVILIFLALMGLSCTISPVITDPAVGEDDLYGACRRAAKEYCRQVVEVPETDMRKCVAQSTFDCVSGGP